MSDSTLDRDYQKRFANPATEHKSFEKWVFHTGLYSSKDGEDVFLKTCGVSKNFLMLGKIKIPVYYCIALLFLRNSSLTSYQHF